MDILVTGGAGYVGSHTCKKLAEKGYHPITYDNLSQGYEHNVRWGHLEIGDINDIENLTSVLMKYKPSAVIHFAASAYAGESTRKPLLYYFNNVRGTLSLLDAMQKIGINQLIFSSSCATYGVPKQIPISEEHPQVPISPYGRSKHMIEQILADCNDSHGLKYIALRYFNAAGADSEGLIGEEHDPEPHLIPRVLMVAAGKIPHFDVYGDDYDTPDGTCIRDYVHVSDLADAHVNALEELKGKNNAKAINLGSNQGGSSVLKILQTAEHITGKNIPYHIGPRRHGDPSQLVADSSLASRVLGWDPQRSDLNTIVSNAWEWEKNR